MAKVRVYQFTVWDIENDYERQSRRWGTHEVILRVHGCRFSFMMALFAFHRGTQQFGEQMRKNGFSS